MEYTLIVIPTWGFYVIVALLALNFILAVLRGHKGKIVDANGNDEIVRRHKTGATAHVSPTYAPRFQSYIDDIEATGAKVEFMGGYRRGPLLAGP